MVAGAGFFLGELARKRRARPALRLLGEVPTPPLGNVEPGVWSVLGIPQSQVETSGNQLAVGDVLAERLFTEMLQAITAGLRVDAGDCLHIGEPGANAGTYNLPAAQDSRRSEQ